MLLNRAFELLRSQALSLPSRAKFAIAMAVTVAVSSSGIRPNMTSNNVGGGLCRLAHFYDNMGALKALGCHGQPLSTLESGESTCPISGWLPRVSAPLPARLRYAETLAQ